MKDKIFGVLQRVGRSFMLPIAILPVAGLLLGIGSSFTNAAMIETYGLQNVLGEGTILNGLLTIMSKAGSVIFDNLPLIFAVGVAIGMAKKEKEVAALAAMISFFVMHVCINAMLVLNGDILADGTLAEHMLDGTVSTVCGIQSLQMGVFGGIIVGLGVAALHNRFYKIQLPSTLSFFGGSRFVPIISTVVYVGVGILMYFIWPVVQEGIYALGGVVLASGYAGTWIYGIIERALIPFGLHHVFYMPFWQTGVGGEMLVDGTLIQGAQNIFFAQLASPNTTEFSVEATRFMAGKFPFMIFGLPGAALAMYKCAKPEKKKIVGGLLLSAALTSMLTGITEPLEFTFLFVAPLMYAVHCVLAGLSYMLMHILNVGVGMTFSGGIIDMTLFGILQGNEKTHWIWIIVVGAVYFVLYYFVFSFMITKMNLKTPGREDDSEETKLFTKADYQAKQGTDASAKGNGTEDGDEKSILITRGLGGRKNISDVDCCATRLRCTVHKPELVNEALLKATSPSGIIRKGQGIQIIYGPVVAVIKSNLEDYLEKAPDEEYIPAEQEEENTADTGGAESSGAENSSEASSGTVKKVLCSPFSGEAAPITEASDEVFAGKMMGDGYIVRPEEGMAYAPEDAEVSFVFPSKHAVGLRSGDGTEYLLHIGVDTVNLNGEGFETFVKDGDRVKKGDKLIGFDIEYIKEHAKSDECIIVFTSLQEGEEVRLTKPGRVAGLDETAEIVSFN